jgi:hypothetical protein
MVAKAIQTPNNVYILNEFNGSKCFMGKIDEIWLWHKIMGHMNFDNLVKIDIKKEVTDMPKITKPSSIVSRQCQHGKKSRVSFNTKEYATSKPLEIVHTNLYEPSRTKILQGEN